MGLQEIIEGKKEWREHKSRIKELPRDYQIVYKEIEKYFFKVGPYDAKDMMDLLGGVVSLFEESSSEGKEVLEVTGEDVASFCDELIKDTKTYFDMHDEYMRKEMSKAIDKSSNK